MRPLRQCKTYRTRNVGPFSNEKIRIARIGSLCSGKGPGCAEHAYATEQEQEYHLSLG